MYVYSQTMRIGISRTIVERMEKRMRMEDGKGGERRTAGVPRKQEILGGIQIDNIERVLLPLSKLAIVRGLFLG